MEELREIAAEVPAIQRSLVERHGALAVPDRAAHQMQIGASRVALEVAPSLPAELDGLGVFQPGARHTGLGRVSTGLGCPHIETDLDFLGVMLAFQTDDGRRVDFLGINDPRAPTNTVRRFVDLLGAAADSAGTHVPLGRLDPLHTLDFVATQLRLLRGLVRRLGLGRALRTYARVARQTARILTSKSAVQPYWTGVVTAGDTPGKFTFVPETRVGRRWNPFPGERFLSRDWRERAARGEITFEAYWIPWLDEERTPLDEPAAKWEEEHRVAVGTVSFVPADDPREARLLALLAAEMGANPGNWISGREDEAGSALPATEFTAGRALAYARGQEARGALTADACRDFFATGEISDGLARELERRCAEKTRRGHAVPVPPPEDA